jgi:hypothetical protein
MEALRNGDCDAEKRFTRIMPSLLEPFRLCELRSLEVGGRQATDRQVMSRSAFAPGNGRRPGAARSRHLSFAICHLSFAICHLSFAICHLSFAIFHR